jgi:hypothetical protein
MPVIELLIRVRWNILVCPKFTSEFLFTFWNRTPVCLFVPDFSLFPTSAGTLIHLTSQSSSSFSMWFVHPLCLLEQFFFKENSEALSAAAAVAAIFFIVLL